MDEFTSISVISSRTYSLEVVNDKALKKYDKISPLFTTIDKEVSKIINAYDVVKVFRFDNDYIKSSTVLMVEAIVDGIPSDIHRTMLHRLVNRCCNFGSWGYSSIYYSVKEKYFEK